MKKSRFDASSLYSNNYLKLNGYAMIRRSGFKKFPSLAYEAANFPFPEVCPYHNKHFRTYRRLNRKK